LQGESDELPLTAMRAKVKALRLLTQVLVTVSEAVALRPPGAAARHSSGSPGRFPQAGSGNPELAHTKRV